MFPSFVVVFALYTTTVVAVPAHERWPNLGPHKEDILVIRPTSEIAPYAESYSLIPKEDPVYHSTYRALGQLYPPTVVVKDHDDDDDKKYPGLFKSSGHLYGFPEEPKKIHYPHHHKVYKVKVDEDVIRKHYNALVDKKVGKKTHFIQKAVEKTIDVTAKLAKYTVDFINKVAIETAAKLAKSGAKHIIHKKIEQIHDHYD